MIACGEYTFSFTFPSFSAAVLSCLFACSAFISGIVGFPVARTLFFMILGFGRVPTLPTGLAV